VSGEALEEVEIDTMSLGSKELLTVGADMIAVL
jgi:hypothetical protein